MLFPKQLPVEVENRLIHNYPEQVKFIFSFFTNNSLPQDVFNIKPNKQLYHS